MIRPPPRSRWSRGARRGFTFIELMAVMVILAALGSVSSFLLANAIDGYVKASTTAQIHADLSTALDRLTREFHSIPPYPAVAGEVAYIDSADDTAGDSAFSWFDSDDDEYSVALNGTDLELAVNDGAAADLLTDVTAFTLGFREEDDDPIDASPPLVGTPAVDDIRRITVSMTVSRKGISRTLSAKVYIRSCMSGS